MKYSRRKLNEKEYIKIAKKECFICNIVNNGNLRKEHAIVYEDADNIVFLNKYPTQIGYVLVCPKQHKVDIFRDLKKQEYAKLMELARKTGKAIQQITDAERMYIASWGSRQLNEHIHLHICPCPKGLPFKKQQINAMEMKQAGIIIISANEKEKLKEKIQKHII